MSQKRLDRGFGKCTASAASREYDGSEEAGEEHGVLYPLIYGLHSGDVGGVELRRQAEVHRDRVGVEDAGDKARGEGCAGQREDADGRPCERGAFWLASIVVRDMACLLKSLRFLMPR